MRANRWSVGGMRMGPGPRSIGDRQFIRLEVGIRNAEVGKWINIDFILFTHQLINQLANQLINTPG